ncbi:MAG: right-handed parallel beta-helix repeat-containing protein, partial [Candidatus Aenigmatarchaeota archaeon]
SAQNTTLFGNIGENNSYGFYLSSASSSGSVLKGNTAKNSTSQGFSLYYTKNVTLEDNIAIGIPRGIYTFNTTDAKIHNSNITGCDWSIVLENSSDITMTDNIVTDSKYYGIFVNGNAPYHFAHTIPTSNTVNGKPVYYNHSLSNYAFDGLDAGHIECAFCNGVNITNSQAIGDGIILRFSNNSRIEQCDVSTTYSSLWGYKLENTSINNSVFNYNSNIEYSNNTFISNSTFQNSSTDLRIFRVNNTFISNSTFQNASRGLSVSSSNNTFISNSTFQNASTGLYVSSANNTFISNSTFQNASTGLYVSSANNISIDTSRFLDSDNCIFASPKTGFLTNSNFSNCITSTITGSWQDSNISGNKIENCGESVVSLTVNNSIISYNNISNCSSTVIIIHLDGSGIEFSNNIFENSSTMDYFVDLAVSPTTTLTNNVRKNLFRNITALVILYIENSQNISVEDNEFINNTASSILTLWAVTNSTFSGNYFNNSPDSVDYSIVIGDTDTTNNVFHHNYFYNSSILHAFAEEPGNHFNITGSGAQGNYWDDIGNLQIYDIDGDGYGDSGPDYPYSNATGGRVSPNVVDWGPILEEDVTPPQITIISPENITYCSSSLWANISCNEPCNWAGYSLDGQPNVSMSSTDYWNWSAYLTGLSNGQHNITFWANDTSGNMNQSDYVWFSIDISGPYWSGNITAPASPTTYQPGKNYQFNITWTDPNSIDTALIRGNFTGTMQNYTPTKVGDVYSITIADLAAGTYAWGSWANDSICGNSNSTPDWIYLVNKAETILTLSAQPAWSVTYGTQTNITCSANNNEAQIALYRNDSQVASGYGLVYESTTLAAGLWNYTCNTSGSQNWTAASVSNLLNVTLADTNPPGIIFITPTPTNASYRNINWVYINISVTDDTSNIDACWVEWNGSNYTMTKVGSGLSVTCWYNMTDLADGIYSYKAWANDSVGNVGLSEERIVTIDTEPPKILNVRAESITTSSAVIKWDTDEEANATVRYGKTQALGSVRSNSSFALNHTIDLVNLESGTLYYYNVSSCDRAGNCNMTGLYNFTTNIYIPPRPPAGGAGPSISYLHIIVNVTPQEVVISPNIIVLFEVVDFDSLTRSLRWTGTDKGKVTFTIQGMAIELPLNKRVDIDLNGDNENDIWITVTRIDATVTFLIAKIPKEIPAPPEIICQPGERRCEGRELQECGREGTEWRTLVICEYACVNLTCLVPPVIPIGPTAAPPVEITSLAIAIASIAILSGIFYAKRRLRKGLADVMKDVYGMIKQGKTDYQIRNALQTAGLGTRTIELILQEMRSRPNKIDAMMGWVQEQIKAGKSKKEIKKQLMREGWPKEMAEMAIRD